MKTKYFLDTEFIENGVTIDLISIGIVCEDGREFYRQNLDCHFSKASDWVRRNVFMYLEHFDMRGERICLGQPSLDSMSGSRLSRCSKNGCPWATHSEIRNAVKEFFGDPKESNPEIWGYFADYDWVVFCQLFGTMMELPNGFPMYCNDIKQLCNSVGNPDLPKQGKDEHHALSDARWNKSTYEFLQGLKNA